MAGQKAIVISGPWLTVFVGLMVTAVGSGVTTAINAYGQIERLRESTTNLANDIQALKSADLPLKLAEVRAEQAINKEITARIENKQAKMDDKIDLLLQQRKDRE